VGLNSIICVPLVFTLAGSPAWGNPDTSAREAAQERPGSGKKLVIGTVVGHKRPDGFVVEDLRAGMMKKSERRQTYKREYAPFRVQRGPFAIYETNVGDTDLNVSSIDLFAEQMISRYGDKLTGKRLLVREFSFTLKESVDKPQGVYFIPLGPAAVGAAIIGTIVGTATMQAMGGRSLSLVVKINAELDGKRFESSDYGSVIPETVDERPANIVNGALKYGFYKFELPELRLDETTAPKPDHGVDKPAPEPERETDAAIKN